MGDVQCRAITGPIKTRAWIGLAFRRNIGMTGNVANGIDSLQCARERHQLSILRIRKRYGISSLKLYADGIIVAAIPPLPAGFSRMPGPLLAGNELNDFPIPPNEEVSRNLETAKLRIIGVSFEIK